MKIGKKNKIIQNLHTLINICVLLLIDFLIIKYVYNSSDNWLDEVGKRKLAALIIGNILILLMLIRQNSWKLKYQNTVLI